MIATLRIEEPELDRLQSHLARGRPEQAAFLFATAPDTTSFDVVEMRLLEPRDFEYQSEFHISLADHVRPEVIKYAWDTDTMLIEAHSHRSDQPAKFSPSDAYGLSEFVPHVLWRLPRKPYGALVFGATSFDSLVWVDSPDPKGTISLVTPSGTAREPTGLSLRSWRKDTDDWPL